MQEAPKTAPPKLPHDAEWLLTDGAGGFACGAVDGLSRRRYHAAWIAWPTGSERRHNVVAAFDERLPSTQPPAHLLAAHWRGQAQPSPGAGRVAFTARPLPTWTFTVGAAVLERTLALRPVAVGAPCLLVRYRNLGSAALRLEVRPLLGWCDADHLIAADERFDATVHARGASWGVRPDDRLPRK